MFVRVDALPNKLFRWTGSNWMELSKEVTDSYLNEDYVKHLTYLVQNGHAELEELTKQEQEEVENAIRRHSGDST